MSEHDTDHADSYEVLVVGGGVAGLMAATYTARAGLSTLVVSDGESILRRNAHLENVPGFPAGVNARLFVDMLDAQATRNGAERRDGRVVSLERATSDADRDEAASDEGAAPRFVATTEAGDRVGATYVVAASWSDSSYLDPLGVEIREAGSKAYVEDDGHGRTTVEGVYAAGRLAERYHQAAVAAGDGAQVAITLIHDSNTPFYHDWVVPEGYFTDRGREVPPGCEEIDATEQAARQAESRAAMREYFADEHDDRQRTHPSLVEDDRGRLPDEEWDRGQATEEN